MVIIPAHVPLQGVGQKAGKQSGKASTARSGEEKRDAHYTQSFAVGGNVWKRYNGSDFAQIRFTLSVATKVLE